MWIEPTIAAIQVASGLTEVAQLANNKKHSWHEVAGTLLNAALAIAGAVIYIFNPPLGLLFTALAAFVVGIKATYTALHPEKPEKEAEKVDAVAQKALKAA